MSGRKERRSLLNNGEREKRWCYRFIEPRRYSGGERIFGDFAYVVICDWLMDERALSHHSRHVASPLIIWRVPSSALFFLPV